MFFELLAQDGKARVGRLRTSHGSIETPVFMPVGTQGTVKAVMPNELESLGTEILLSNTYHLFIRPGMETMETVGGLHRFMNWEGPILTDSGGYQVFSLAKLRKIIPEGVHFQSHVDGAPLFLSPKEAVDIQKRLGSDIMMAFDVCPPWDATKDAIAEAVEKTLRWAHICRTCWEELPAGPTQEQFLFGIVQGASHADLREECARKLVDLDLPGYAIGGVSVGEPEPEMLAAVEATEPFLPKDKPRYAMGLGQPDQLVKMVARGVDMFDCVLPTRIARNGTAYTSQGTINLRNAQYRNDSRPIEDLPDPYPCRGFSRAYIRHLLKAEEILGLRLVSLHNLCFYFGLMRQMRSAIRENRFKEWSEKFLKTYKPKETNDDELE